MTASDLRLVAPAIGCWAGVAWTLAAPVRVSVAGAAVLGVAALVTGAAATTVSERRSLFATLAAVCGLTALASVSVLLRIAAVDGAPVAREKGKPVVVVQMTGDPHYLPHGRMLVPVSVRELDSMEQRPVDAVLVATADGADPLPGERYRVRVRVRPPRAGAATRLQAAQLTAVDAPIRVQDAPWWQRAAGVVRERLRESASLSLGERSAGLLPGLILGDTSGLDEQTADGFTTAGLSHLVAVSGSNFVVAVGALVFCVRASGAGTRLTVVVGVVATVGFVILVRPSDSVLRAAVMGSVGLAAVVASRRSQALPALGAAVVVVVLTWPTMAVAPGFALSVSATAGLVFWSAPIRDWLLAHRVPRGLSEVLAMTLAAQILTTPVLMVALDGQFSWVAVPANLLVAPVVPVVTILGTGAALVGALGPPDGAGTVIAQLLIRMCGPELWWLVSCADRLGGATWARSEFTPAQVWLILGSVAATVGVVMLRRRDGAATQTRITTGARDTTEPR